MSQSDIRADRVNSVSEPRFSHPRLPHHADDLAVAGLRRLQGPAEPGQLGLPAYEVGQPARRRRLQPPPRRAASRDRIHIDGRIQAADRPRAERRHTDVPFGQPEGIAGGEDGSRLRHLLHAGRKVRGLPDGRIVHVEVVADGPNHYVARVEPDPDLDRHAAGMSDLLGVAPDRSCMRSAA